MPSVLETAKRALVTLIRALAITYGFEPNVSRDSTDAQVQSAFRLAARRVHQDKGGNGADAAKLNDTKAAWDDACKQSKPAGRPREGAVATQ